jgi:7-cyano-7-deazaguanine synthase in queuosine biosynthesis
MKGVILCMYSGGLDSAGMLHFLLTREEYKDFAVHVHHMHLVNPENRALVEHAATMNALEHLRKSGYRAFSYSESLHRYPAFNQQIIWDADLCAFMAGNICNATPDVRYVALGRTRTDIDEAGHDFQGRMARAQEIFRAVKALNKNPSEYIFPVAQMTKREIWDALPPELRAHTWSCRRPIYVGKTRAVACGRCISCRALGIQPPPESLVAPKAEGTSGQDGAAS